MTVSYNGWDASSRDAARIVNKTVPGTDVVLPVSADAADVLVWVAHQFDERVEPLHRGWCWGYADRLVRGSTTIVSNHASGSAIDLNAPKHPLGKSGTFSAEQVRQIRRILRKSKVVTWGADWRRPDEMHFEIKAGVSPAKARAVGRRLVEHPRPPRLKRGSRRRFWVRKAQRLLGVPADGVYGAETVAAVKAFRRRHRIWPANGRIGRRVWRQLLR